VNGLGDRSGHRDHDIGAGVSPELLNELALLRDGDLVAEPNSPHREDAGIGGEHARKVVA
jgi:hypothetical protein